MRDKSTTMEKCVLLSLLMMLLRNLIKTSTPVENISQKMNKFKTDEGYDRDLVHVDERIQDNALKNYYDRIVITSDHKRRILAGCIMFSRQVKPVIAVIFVVSYWSAGLWNYYRLE